MTSYDNKRTKKIMTIALDMHQPKEVRIQAVRVLRVMDAVDELWTVAQNVKCPFTRQSAIDSIPALELVPQKHTDEMSVSGNVEVDASGPTRMNVSSGKLEWP